MNIKVHFYNANEELYSTVVRDFFGLIMHYGK